MRNIADLPEISRAPLVQGGAESVAPTGNKVKTLPQESATPTQVEMSGAPRENVRRVSPTTSRRSLDISRWSSIAGSIGKNLHTTVPVPEIILQLEIKKLEMQKEDREVEGRKQERLLE